MKLLQVKMDVPKGVLSPIFFASSSPLAYIGVYFHYFEKGRKVKYLNCNTGRKCNSAIRFKKISLASLGTWQETSFVMHNAIGGPLFNYAE